MPAYTMKTYWAFILGFGLHRYGVWDRPSEKGKLPRVSLDHHHGTAKDEGKRNHHLD